MSKLLIFYLCLTALIRENFVIPKKLNHQSAITKQIFNLKTHQATVFTKNSANLKTNSFFNNLISKIPAVIVDSEKNFDHYSSIASAINLTRKSNLLLIQQDAFDLEEIQSNLENFIKVSPVKIRPKCLVIFNDSAFDYYSIESVLLYGWSKKFLDMTVVNLKSRRQFHYNPFSNDFKNKSSIKIFPNKLKNMNKYPIRFKFMNIPPFIFKVKIDNATLYCGLDVDILKLFEKALNFKSDFSLTESTPELDMLSGRLPVSYNADNSMQIGKSFFEICAVVANKKSLEMKLSVTKVIGKAPYIVVTLSIINLIHRALSFMKLDSDIFQYVAALLSQPTDRFPKTVVVRIILLFLGVFSMSFFPEIVAELTEIFVTYEEKTISNYKDALDANLIPHVSDGDLVSRSTDEHLKDMLIKNMGYNEDKCLQLAIKQQNVLCILSVLKARMYLKKFKKANGDSLLKITEIDFPELPESMYFSPASSYVETFDRVAQKISETGILDKIFEAHFNVSTDANTDQFVDEEGQVIIYQSLSIFLFCLPVFAIIFITELLN